LKRRFPNVLTDFYDSLKSITSGYGSFNYELGDYRTENLVRLDILVGGELIDSLSLVIHKDEAYRAGKEIVEKLKEIIPKQSFEVSCRRPSVAKSSPEKTSKPCAKT
jgi:GTP-binding protein LepA